MIYDNEAYRAATALAEPDGEGTPPETPVLLVHIDEGGVEAPKRYTVPLLTARADDAEHGWTPGEPMLPFTAIANRPFIRTVGGELVACDRIVRIEGMP